MQLLGLVRGVRLCMQNCAKPMLRIMLSFAYFNYFIPGTLLNNCLCKIELLTFCDIYV